MIWRENLTHCWQDRKLTQLLWKSIWRILNKLKIELPYGAPRSLPKAPQVNIETPAHPAEVPTSEYTGKEDMVKPGMHAGACLKPRQRETGRGRDHCKSEASLVNTASSG